MYEVHKINKGFTTFYLTMLFIAINILTILNTHWAAERLEMEKNLKDFGACHENSLIGGFKTSPHMLCLS